MSYQSIEEISKEVQQLDEMSDEEIVIFSLEVFDSRDYGVDSVAVTQKDIRRLGLMVTFILRILLRRNLTSVAEVVETLHGMQAGC